MLSGLVHIYVFNLDFTNVCLDIPVPSINKNFIIIVICAFY